MNRNDMPFLGVYDLFGTALIVPLHINTGDGALFLNISYHRFFPDYLRARDGRFELHPLSCIYILTAVSLWSCIGKRIDVDMKCLEYFFYILGCLIVLYNFVNMIVQKIQGASNIYTQYNIPLWIIVGIGFVLIGRTIALQKNNQ